MGHLFLLYTTGVYYWQESQIAYFDILQMELEDRPDPDDESVPSATGLPLLLSTHTTAYINQYLTNRTQ